MLFGKWSGTEDKIDGQELLIMKESEIAFNTHYIVDGAIGFKTLARSAAKASCQSTSARMVPAAQLNG